MAYATDDCSSLAQWTAPSGVAPFTVVSASLQEDTSGSHTAMYHSVVPAAAQQAQCQIVGPIEDILHFGVGPATRIQTGAASWFKFFANSNASGELEFSKVIAGVQTDIAAYIAGSSPVANDTLKLISDAAHAHSCFHNGTLRIGPLTDSQFATGRVGVAGAAFDFLMRVDNWEGGDIPVASSSKPIRLESTGIILTENNRLLYTN